MTAKHVMEPTKIDEQVFTEFLTTLEDLGESITDCKIKINILLDQKRQRSGNAKIFILEEDLRKKVNNLSAAIKIVKTKTSSFLASLRIASGQSRWKWW